MFVTTKSCVKLANRNTGHAQGIRIILCHFSHCSIIYPVVPVYYCPGHPSNTTSSVALIFYVGFQKVTSEPLEHCDFVDPQGCSWRSTYYTKNSTNFKYKLSKWTLTETGFFLYQLYMPYQNQTSLRSLISVLVMSLIPG